MLNFKTNLLRIYADSLIYEIDVLQMFTIKFICVFLKHHLLLYFWYVSAAVYNIKYKIFPD